MKTKNPTMTKHSTNQEVFQLLTIQHETWWIYRDDLDVNWVDSVTRIRQSQAENYPKTTDRVCKTCLYTWKRDVLNLTVGWCWVTTLWRVLLRLQDKKKYFLRATSWKWFCEEAYKLTSTSCKPFQIILLSSQRKQHSSGKSKRTTQW